nr:circadian-associated transcriptional repressor isoform X2 [Zootoca vivipara]
MSFLCPRYISMAAMDSSSKSVSSGESLYSVESATSEEDDDRCADFDIFLSDGGSDTEKESGALKHHRGAYSGRQPFLFSPEPLGRTSPSLPCRERNRRTRKPLGLLAAARLRPTGPCCHHPAALDEAYYSRLADTDRGLPRKPTGRRRAESGRCQNGGVQPHPYAAQPPLRGVKKQRNRGVADREDVHSPSWTEGDHIFAQKCLELQGFIHPLVELLNRLKMGRFDRGLSSFQQSVAMDRIQRIIGVLQKPEMGERYLGTLLQVERMLKLWFPHIALRNACADCGVAATQDSCDTAESSMEENLPETLLPPGQGPAQSPPTAELHQTHLGDPASPSDKATAPLGESPRFLGGDWPAMNLTWIHTSPISTPPLGNVDVGQASSVFGQTLLGPKCTAYGLVVFLQNNPVTPRPFGHPTSSTPAHLSMSCRHANRLHPSPEEPPRSQSLPGATATGSCLGQGPHSGFSRSLPHLPTLGEGHMATSNGRPTSRCDS